MDNIFVWDVLTFFHDAEAAFEKSKKTSTDYKIYLRALDIICSQFYLGGIDLNIIQYIYKHGLASLLDDKKRIKLKIDIATFPYVVKALDHILEAEAPDKIRRELFD